MNHAIPNLQIHIHKVDGATTTFVQNDAGEVRKILDGFEPAHIFDREKFVITDGNSITSLPVSKITRIDLVSERQPHLIFPVGIVDAVELTETEFQTLIRNTVLREQWEEMTTQEDSLVTFLDLELADGQCLFLTTEMHVQLQSEEPWKTNGHPLAGSSLCFRRRDGGMAVLNLANVIRLTFFPKPVHSLAGAWHAGQFYSPPLARHFAGSHAGAAVAGNPPPASFFPAEKNLNFQRK
jgi:hypothetical protein